MHATKAVLGVLLALAFFSMVGPPYAA
jgi:hypothetical protein